MNTQINLQKYLETSILKNNVNNGLVTQNNLEYIVNNKVYSIGQNGGSSTGVSVVNIASNNDIATQMLIPSNFLTTNHVYFVRNHPEGTQLYNYKLNMKGGKINDLQLYNINSIGESNKITGSMTNSALLNGQVVLNNLINELKTTQMGGYVTQRVSDKDNYYHEYKDAKLKYLKLKEHEQNGGFLESLKKAFGFGIVWKETDRIKNKFDHKKVGSVSRIVKDATTKKTTIYVKYDGSDSEVIETDVSIIKPTDESFDELKERLNKELTKLNGELESIQGKYDAQKPITDTANTVATTAQAETKAAKNEEDIALKKKKETDQLYQRKLSEIANLEKRIKQEEKDNEKLLENIQKDKTALEQTKIESTSVQENVEKVSAIELEKLNIYNSKLADSDIKIKEANKQNTELNKIDKEKKNIADELAKIRKLLDKTTTEESTLLSKQN